QYRPEGGRLILRLLLDRFADRPVEVPAAGVTLDELARISRELSDVLDAHDVVPGRYHLECSSPGLNRPLVRPEHFRRAVGQRVRVRVHEPGAGGRRFGGVRDDAPEQSTRVNAPDAGVVLLALDGIERASTEFESPSPGGKGPRNPGGGGPRHAHA